MLFRVQVFQGSGSRVRIQGPSAGSRVRVQALEVAYYQNNFQFIKIDVPATLVILPKLINKVKTCLENKGYSEQGDYDSLLANIFAAPPQTFCHIAQENTQKTYQRNISLK